MVEMSERDAFPLPLMPCVIRECQLKENPSRSKNKKLIVMTAYHSFKIIARSADVTISLKMRYLIQLALLL